MKKTQKILIVGGGISGLASANILAKYGFHVDLIERCPQWLPVGAGISLNSNAMKILQTLGMREKIEENSHIIKRFVISDYRDTKLNDLDFIPFNKIYGNSVAIHRAVLHEIMLFEAQQAGANIHLGTTVENFSAQNSGVEVSLSNSISNYYDLIIGADGIRSQVRNYLFPEVQPKYSGYTCWRFIIPSFREIKHPIKMLGYGKQFGIVPIGNEQIYCFATNNAAAGIDIPDKKQHLLYFKDLFKEFGGYVPTVLEALTAEALLHNDIEEVVCPEWHKNNFVLVGDAAHAMTPNLGQGGAMAVEDIYILARELQTNSIPHALQQYQKNRYPRVRFVQNQSRKIGKFYQAQSVMKCLLRNFALKTAGKVGMRITMKRLANFYI